MPTQIVTFSAVSVGANAVSAEQFTNTPGQYVAGAAILRMRLAAAAAGLLVTLIVGGRPVVLDQPMNSSNRWPILPDDLLGEFPFGGGRLWMTVRNNTAAAITFSGVAEIIQ